MNENETKIPVEFPPGFYLSKLSNQDFDLSDLLPDYC